VISDRLAEKQGYFGSKEWADDSLKYLLGLLSDNSTWNLPHNWHMKRTVAFLILERLREKEFFWHYKIAHGHFTRWLKRRSWIDPITGSAIGSNKQLQEAPV